MMPQTIRKLKPAEREYMCYNSKCTEDATHELIVEADSFGVETEQYCDLHMSEIRNRMQADPLHDDCEWCGIENIEIRHYRDIDEGHNGPIHNICGNCYTLAIKNTK